MDLKTNLKPTGDQPKAIRKLVKNLKEGKKDQVLLGVTGSGKTFTMAQVINKTKKPALIISHNKTLAAQLYQEFKEFFPNNGVHYFVSYYDYYQPEAYIPQTDTYIEKDAKVNEEIDKLRHAAVQDLLTRDDVIVTASVSCIYNIGSPFNYQKISLRVQKGQEIKRRDLIKQLTSLQYQRNDIDFSPGNFRVRGDTVEIYIVTGKEILKIEFFGDKIEKLSLSKKEIKEYKIFPAQFWVAPQNKLDIAIENIRGELQERLKKLKKERKLLEAQRLEQRTNYDLEMLKEAGWCQGIENYSRQLEFREPNQAPFTLLDYFNRFSPRGNLVFIDESHMTLPQIKAMSIQDRMRKETLIENGFRLPSSLDNRPLTLKEFEKRAKETIYVSATPSDYEKSKSEIIEQIIRPTGLLEPTIEVKTAKNQIKDLTREIKNRTARNQRVLVLTLTKRLAEAVSDHLSEKGIKTQWLHSEIKTLERPGILRDLRKGKFDVLVGINLLREGLDLPEVSLIAILDADKEGFLRNETTLVQIMGRAARHPEGHVILYADKTTKSMKKAITEIDRRREIQKEHNKKHNIRPEAVKKEIRDWLFEKPEEAKTEFGKIRDINLLKKEMKEAAQNLDFERAAEIRDMIKEIRK